MKEKSKNACLLLFLEQAQSSKDLSPDPAIHIASLPAFSTISIRHDEAWLNTHVQGFSKAWRIRMARCRLRLFYYYLNRLGARKVLALSRSPWMLWPGLEPVSHRKLSGHFITRQLSQTRWNFSDVSSNEKKLLLRRLASFWTNFSDVVFKESCEGQKSI